MRKSLPDNSAARLSNLIYNATPHDEPLLNYFEIERWLIENNIDWLYSMPYFYFESEDDRTLFKLRWG